MCWINVLFGGAVDDGILITLGTLFLGCESSKGYVRTSQRTQFLIVVP